MGEGIFNHGAYWHHITATLFQGSSLVLLLAAVVRIFLKPGMMVRRGLDIGLANGTLVVLASVFALLWAILATLTGMWMTWGFEATTSTSLTLNKSMFATFGILALILMLAIRYRYGPGVWKDPALTATYVALAAVQGLVAVVNGSMGGEAGLLGTIFDPVYQLFGINVRGQLVLPTLGAIVLLIVVIAGVLAAVAWRFTRGTKAAEPPEVTPPPERAPA